MRDSWLLSLFLSSKFGKGAMDSMYYDLHDNANYYYNNINLNITYLSNYAGVVPYDAYIWNSSISSGLSSVSGAIVSATTGIGAAAMDAINVSKLDAINKIYSSNSDDVGSGSCVCDPFWLHLIKFLVVMACHRLADFVTSKYGDPSVSTIRCNDATERKEKFLEWDEWAVKRFYVISQFIAIGMLILPHCGATRSELVAAGIDIGFGMLYPIHFAAFLMTLHKAGIIDYSAYTVFYSASLFVSFVYFSFHAHSVYLIGIFMVYLCRCHLRMNKYLLWTLFFMHCQLLKYRC